MANIENAYRTESIELISPTPDIIRVIEIVLEQHSEILKMNATLLDVLSSSILITNRENK